MLYLVCNGLSVGSAWRHIAVVADTDIQCWHWGQYTAPLNSEGRSCNNCCSGKVKKKKYIFWVRVCSIRCPACKAHEPVCHMLLALLYSVFQYRLINDIIFENKVTEHKMCVSIFYTNLSETFLILNRTTPDTIKNVCRSSCKAATILARY